MRDGAENPDGEFVRCGHRRDCPQRPTSPTPSKAHRVVDAMYRSAPSDGALDARSVVADLYRRRAHRRRDLSAAARGAAQRHAVSRTSHSTRTTCRARSISGSTMASDVVAVSTWVPRPYRDEAGSSAARHGHLPSMQGRGIGAILLEAGCTAAATIAPLVWARARDTALAVLPASRFHRSRATASSTSRPPNPTTSSPAASAEFPLTEFRCASMR